MARVYLKGLPQLKAKLRKLAEIAEPTMRKVLAEAATLVVNEIRPRAQWKHIQDSIGWTFGIPPKYSRILASVQTGGLQVTIYVGGPDARDAAWLEHGTRPHIVGGQFAGAVHPGTAPQPFFFPGWRAKRNVVRKMLREAIRDAVRGVAKS